MLYERVVLSASLLPEQCIAKLASKTDDNYALFYRNPMAGRVEHASFKVRKPIYYRNPFQTYVYGKVMSSTTGSIVSCHVGMSLTIVIVFAIWFFVALVFSGFGIWTAFANLSTVHLPFYIDTWGMLAIGAFVVGMGRFLARNEGAFLKTFLCQILDAKIVDPNAAERRGETCA
jgi:hypothetical protein